MPPLSLVTPVDHTDIPLTVADQPPQPFSQGPASSQGPALARVIEVGEVAAGIAVPEDHGVRFFSASRDYDGLDGRLFKSSEQAARAVRDLARPGARKIPRSLAI